MYTIYYKKEKYDPQMKDGSKIIVSDFVKAKNPLEKEAYLKNIKKLYAQYGEISCEVDIAKLKSYVGNQLGLARDEALQAGFVVDGKEYGFNETDQTNMSETLNIFNAKILQTIQKGEPIDNIRLPYKDKSIGLMTLRTFEEFMAIVDGATLHKTNIWNHYTCKIIELNQAITEDEILAVQW